MKVKANYIVVISIIVLLFSCGKDILDNESGEIHATINEENVSMPDANVFVWNNDNLTTIDFWGRHFTVNGLARGTISFSNLQPKLGRQTLFTFNRDQLDSFTFARYNTLVDDGDVIGGFFDIDPNYAENYIDIQSFDAKDNIATGEFKMRVLPEPEDIGRFDPLIIEGTFRIRHNDMAGLFEQ